MMINIIIFVNIFIYSIINSIYNDCEKLIVNKILIVLIFMVVE
jgi:hypothetical protein